MRIARDRDDHAQEKLSSGLEGHNVVIHAVY
jgi:hypothetical protein